MLKVYYLRVSDFAGLAADFFCPYVGEDTWQLVQGYKHTKTRQTKLMGEGMVRQLLGLLWGLSRKDYDLGRGEHGKPYVKTAGKPVYFNLSHSGDYIVGAFSHREVGVDIERRKKQRMEVARRFFHPEEIRHLEMLEEMEQRELFFNYWSVKESFLKYTGHGLSSSLSGFEVQFLQEEIAIMRGAERQSVFVRECPIDEDYKCFVCSESPEVPEILPFELTAYL